MKSLVVMLLAVTGCIVGDAGGGGDDGTANGGGDGNGNGSATPDTGTGTGSGTATGTGSGSGQQTKACTNAVYDPCTDNSQCTSGKCQVFQQSGFQVCTQTCTPGDSSTCPTQNGQPAQCNNMGICKPAVATTCTR
jgi:hypothetical protein